MAKRVFLLFLISFFTAFGAGSKNFKYVGLASYYSIKFNGRKTASGEILNVYALTAAHRTLPFGTKVKVTSLDTGKSVIVKINDRGPYVKGRVIDLSREAAKRLGILKKGVGRVVVEPL